MARHLLILRHAKSAWDTAAAADFDRPLAKRGQKDVPLMGAWLREQKLIPDHVLSSPAERAKQTALGVCHLLDIKEKKIHWDRRIYGADTEELLEVLSELPAEVKTVLLVGHNPGLEDLAAYLVGDLSHKAAQLSATDADDAGEYGIVKTATLVHLETTAEWDKLKQRCATLLQVKYPRTLHPSAE
ncbi:MAG: histidine phosphatase family protein [Magnetococcales bacterium]|nr:histidine phosphatase family protein [Magnetococcales bacterium]